MKMTKRRRDIIRRQCESDEKVILSFFARKKDRVPDGSFAMHVWMAGYRAGKADARKEAKERS